MYTAAAYFAVHMLTPSEKGLVKRRSPGDADADSPFSAASNPLYDEQLAARRDSELRSPDDGTDQGDQGDVLQLRRCAPSVKPDLHWRAQGLDESSRLQSPLLGHTSSFLL